MSVEINVAVEKGDEARLRLKLTLPDASWHRIKAWKRGMRRVCAFNTPKTRLTCPGAACGKGR
jgi:hypothetical protein